MKGMSSLHLTSSWQEQASSSSSGQTKRPRDSTGSQKSNLEQKRGRFDDGNVEQRGIYKTPTKSNRGNTPTSYAGVVKSGGLKLVVTRKESEGKDSMNNTDLCEIQGAITKMILRMDPGFFVRVERTFLFEGKVLMICKDEKTLEWAKRVIGAIEPIPGKHPGYVARGPKDYPPAKSFGIWIPDSEGLNANEVLTLINRCNSEIQRKDMRPRYSAKGDGGILHVVAVQEPSLTALKKLDLALYAGYRRMQFQAEKETKPKQKTKEMKEVPEVPVEGEATKMVSDSDTSECLEQSMTTDISESDIARAF